MDQNGVRVKINSLYVILQEISLTTSVLERQTLKRAVVTTANIIFMLCIESKKRKRFCVGEEVKLY